MITYNYRFEGQASGGQTWVTEGEVTAALPGALTEAIDSAMRDSFLKLTQGNAVFGKPGVGCSGPYDVTSFTITKKADA